MSEQTQVWPRRDGVEIPYRPALRDAAFLLLLTLIFLLPDWVSHGSAYFIDIDEFWSGTVNRPWDTLARALLAEGRLPLWNRYSGLGMPLLGNGVTGLLYPLKLPVLLTGLPIAYEVLVAARLWLAALGMYLFLRARGLVRHPALLGAIGFGLGGYFLRYRNEMYLNIDLLLPWAAYLIWSMRTRIDRGRFLLLALIVYGLATGGNPEAAFWSVVAIAGMILLWARPWRLAIPMLCAGGAGAMLSTAQWLPFFSWIGVGGQTMHPPGMAGLHFPSTLWIHLIMPWFAGRLPEPAFFRPLHKDLVLFDDGWVGMSAIHAWVPNYLGLTLTVLALAALVGVWSRRRELERTSRIEIVVLLLAMVVPLLWMFGFGGLVWIKNLPLLGRLNLTKHPFVLVAFGASWLAAVGASAVLQERLSRRARIGVLVVPALAIALWTALCKLRVLGWYDGPGVYESLAVAVGVLLALFIVQRLGEVRRGSALVAVLTMELFWLNLGHNPRPQEMLAHFERLGIPQKVQQTLDADTSGKQSHPWRAWVAPDLYPPYLNLYWRLPDIRVVDGFIPNALFDWRALGEESRDERLRRLIERGGVLAPDEADRMELLFRRWGVRWHVTPESLPRRGTLERIMRESEIESPDPKTHVGFAYWLHASRIAKVLYQHPPGRIKWPTHIERERPYMMVRVLLKDTIDAAASDGLTYRVEVEESDGTITEAAELPLDPPDVYWRFKRVDLTPWAGQDVTLHFVADGRGSTAWDQGGWTNLYFTPEGELEPSVIYEELGNQNGAIWYEDIHAWPRAYSSRLPEVFAPSELREPNGFRDRGDRVEVLVSPEITAGGGYVFLSDIAVPGWRAQVGYGRTVNGKAEVELREAKIDAQEGGARRRVALKPGAVGVIMTYQPWSVRIGLWVYFTAFVPLLWMVFHRRREYEVNL